jgi:hypothetical protein
MTSAFTTRSTTISTRRRQSPWHLDLVARSVPAQGLPRVWTGLAQNFDSVLGLDLGRRREAARGGSDKDVQHLIDNRAAARKAKDFKLPMNCARNSNAAGTRSRTIATARRPISGAS